MSAPGQPFTVLHVCMGNICRSPMAERLFAARLADELGPDAQRLVRSVSAGTGDWHAGDPMDGMASAQLAARAVTDAGFRARTLNPAMLADADLILVATAEQDARVRALASEAADRTFLLRQFARLVPAADLSAVPAAALDVAKLRARGAAIVAAVDAARGGQNPTRADDLDDPWGRDASYFSRVADEIAEAVAPLAALLAGRSAPWV